MTLIAVDHEPKGSDGLALEMAVRDWLKNEHGIVVKKSDRTRAGTRHV
jgi:hypothetical protein